MNVPDSPQNNNPSANTPGAMDNSDTTISEQSARKDIITRTLVDFQDSFRLFPLQFEKFVFNYWYWLGAGSFLTSMVVNTTFDVRLAQLYPKYFQFFNLIKSDLRYWIPLVVASVLIALAFNGWRRNILPTFQVLLDKGRIYSHSHDTDVAREYRSFLDAYQSALLSNKRYLVIAISVIIIFVFLLLNLVGFLLQDLRALSNPGRFDALISIDSLFGAIWSMVNFLLGGYFFGVAVWAMGVTGWYIKNLTAKFDLSILPSHPDHCGGLKPLGDFCLRMALPILIVTVFLSILGIERYVPEGITTSNMLPAIYLFLFALPLAAIAFFVPLWNIHRKMVVRRDAYCDNFADCVAKLEKKIQSSLDKGILDEARVAREEMEIAQVLHPDKIGYPTWPFDRRILLTFLAPQILPIATLVVQLVQWLPK